MLLRPDKYKVYFAVFTFINPKQKKYLTPNIRYSDLVDFLIDGIYVGHRTANFVLYCLYQII